MKQLDGWVMRRINDLLHSIVIVNWLEIESQECANFANNVRCG